MAAMSREPANESESPELVALMIAYQAGDLAAFEQLYVALQADVYRFMSSRDRAAAGDLVQDTFLEIHRARRTYRPPLPVRPWIFGVANNVLSRHRRAAMRSHRNDIALASEGERAAESDVGAEILDLTQAMAGLPETTREAWRLHHIEGLTFQSIASRLRITKVAAKLRSSRASRMLRSLLSGREDVDDE
jgi:RNA polymerase sigma-70 factor (ECF subfamily)